MSVYIAYKTSAKRPSTASFLARGINGYSAATLTDIAPRGIKKIQQVAYPMYETNIAAFLSATSLGITRIATDLPAPVNFTPNLGIGITFPDVYYVPKFTLTEDQALGLVAAIMTSAPEVIPTKKGGCHLVLRQPKLDHCATLARGADPTSGRLGELGVHDAVIAGKMLYLVELFLRTQTYAASHEAEITVEGSEKKKKKFYGGEFEDSMHGPPYAIRNRDLEEVGRLMGEYTADTSKQSAYREAAAIWEDESRKTIHTTITSKDWVFRAKPSPHQINKNCGPVANVPAGPGLVFPFFPRMIVPDRSSLPGMFLDCHLIRTLGDSTDEYLNEWPAFKTGLRSLSDTEFGTLVGHLVAGMKMSLESQSRMFALVEDGQYLGFCLLGPAFAVEIAGNIMQPVSSEEVAKSLGDLQTHAGAVRTLCTILSGADISGSDGIQEPVLEIVSSGQLYNEVERRKIDKGTMTKIHNTFRGLRFFETYMPMTAVNINEGLFALSDGQEYKPNAPRYIPDNSQVMHDPLFRFLALFGPEAPSPINVRGASFKIPSPKERKYDAPADDIPEAERRQKWQNKFEVQEKDRLPVAILSMKPVLVAFEDWKTALKDGAVKMNLAERAKGHRNIVLTGAQTRVFEVAIGLLAQSKSKRKRVDDGEGPAPRREKAGAVSSVEEMLALFGPPQPALPPRALSPIQETAQRQATPQRAEAPRESVPPPPPISRSSSTATVRPRSPTPTASTSAPSAPPRATTPAVGPVTRSKDKGPTDADRVKAARAKVNQKATIVMDRIENCPIYYTWEERHAGGAVTVYYNWTEFKHAYERMGKELPGVGGDAERKWQLAIKHKVEGV